MRHRIAVIGLGMAARPHALALADLAAQGRVEVAAAVSRSDARQAAFAEFAPWLLPGHSMPRYWNLPRMEGGRL